MQRLKYISTAIVFQEVPEEISLVFNISGCPHKCEGCHSKYLWEYAGIYLLDNICTEIDKYKDYITCVCFMGGDQNIEELDRAVKIVKNTYGLKTCIYSGLNSISEFSKTDMVLYLDYLKVGSYNPQNGGLDNPSTNQRFYYLKKETGGEIIYVDTTNKFRKKKD